MIIRSLILLTVGLAGCNLSAPASDFPYEGPFLVIRTDDGSSVDGGTEDGGDVAPAAPPELVITEILIESSASQPGLGEIGEYIEIMNVGDGPADPRNISLLIVDPSNPGGVPGRIQVARPTTAEEVQVVSGLQPIGPGEFFVFVRYESSEAPLTPVLGAGKVYDYGRFAAGPSLSDVMPRVLELRYASGLDITTFHSVRWEAGEMRRLDDSGSGLLYPEDVSIGLQQGAESAADRGDPQNWCLNDPFIGDSRFRGTPGAPTVCQ